MTNPFSYPSNYMSIQLSQYRNQSFEELVAQAQKNQVDNAGQLSPAELVFLLVCQASSNYDGRPEIHADGLLEVLSDGYGFLRSPVSHFDTGADDIYVSPAQIRRFNLRTGDWVQGMVRTPRDNERYLALLRIESVNGSSPEKERKRMAFEHQSLAIERVTHDGALDGVNQGDAVLVRLSPRQHTSDMVFPFIQRSETTVLTLLNYSVEDVAVLQRSWPEGVRTGSMLISKRGTGAQQHQRILELGRQRTHRLVEQGQNVHWIVSTANEIALAACALQEQQGKSGVLSAGTEAVQSIVSERRALETTGSLTIWLMAHEGRSAYQDDLLSQIGLEVHQIVTVQSDGQLTFLS